MTHSFEQHPHFVGPVTAGPTALRPLLPHVDNVLIIDQIDQHVWGARQLIAQAPRGVDGISAAQTHRDEQG